MDSPVKLLQQARRRVQSVTYGSAIYRMMLDQGPLPERIRLTISDPWPGDAKRGQTLIASQGGLFDTDDPLFQDGDFLAHEWLRDLRAVGSDLARRKAVSLIEEWIEDQDEWDEESWLPGILGARLANWIAFFDFYSPVASDVFLQKQRLFMVRQLRHLLNVGPSHHGGIEGLNVVKGLIYGGLALLDSEKSVGLAFDLLKRELAEEILPDGGVISRSPLRHAEMLKALIDIRGALREGQLEIPHELALSIARMVPVLKFFRHGDGGLAVFNGGDEFSSLMLDAIVTLSEAKGRALKHLPQMGYERLTGGRCLLLVDTGAPPPRGFDQEAQAGLLSFEFSVGRERLIVNCGAPPGGDGEWRRAMGATAAHSAVILGDTNACEILADGGIGHRPRTVDSQRYEENGAEFVEAGHDGYLPRQKAVVQRLLGLSKEGDRLLGREVIDGPKGRDFTIRWHLHPSVMALLVQGGGSALLRTPSGLGWRLRVEGACAADLALESSIYCAGGAPRRTLQVRMTGRTRENRTVVEWSLSRETIKKGN